MAVANFRFLNAYNGYLPELTGQVIAFASKPEQYALNDYVQFVQTEYSFGAYSELGRDEFVRVVSVDEDVWEDADVRPMDDRRKPTHRMISFRTQRRARDAYVGYKAIEQVPDWKPKETHSRICLTQTHTAMAQRVITLLTTGANWSGATADANILNGGAGTWPNAASDPNSPNYFAILKTLNAVTARIHLATNGQVSSEQLRFIVGPTLAQAMSVTPEINEYCKSSPAAREILEKGLDPQFQKWGLPKTYRGYQFVVEDAPIVTTLAQGDGTETTVTDPTSTTASRRYIMPNDKCIVASRPGALEGEASGGPNFSTVQIYYYRRRLEVEGFNDSENRRYRQSVVVDQVETLAAPVSGYYITAAA